MGISFLEILFSLNIIAILIVWVWFIILGFRANKAWGFSIIFLTPVTPFMFASRFARKARRAIYYHVIAWFIVVCLGVYIQFFTVNFYRTFFWKLAPESLVVLINEPVEEIKTPVVENQEIDPEIIEDVSDETVEEFVVDETIEEPVADEAVVESKPKSTKRSYQMVSIQDVRLYVGKKVIVSTAYKKHKGRLSAVTASSVVIKKYIAGGSTSMPIKKNKIIKVEVYL